MPAYLPSSGKGDVNWRNLTDNWTHNDTVWLQERTVTRIDSSYTLGTPGTSGDNVLYNINEGRVFYNLDTKILSVSNGTSLNTILTSGNVLISDGVSSSELRGTTASAGTGITISKSGASLTFGSAATFSSTVGTGDLTVTGTANISSYFSTLAGSGGSVSTSSSGLTINTSGSNAAVLTTSAGGLAISTSVAITGSLSTTNSITAGNGLSVTSGTSSLGATTVSSTLGVTGATTLAAMTASGVVTANGTVVVGGTNPSVLSATGKDLIINSASGQAVRTTSNFYYGTSGTTTKNAWVIYQSSGTPTVGDYPEGTIWIS